MSNEKNGRVIEIPQEYSHREERMPAIQQQGAVTPMQLLQIATQQGADVEKLKQLMDLQLRWEQNEARKAFVSALNEFKANPPRIAKNKDVDFTSPKGRTHYKHATLDDVSGIIGAALAKVGIAHRWETEQLEGGLIRVTCILTHSMGHSERVWLQAGRDDSGNKNSIQAVGSTVTYLQRYTLLAATGMATGEADDDGAGGKGGMPENARTSWLDLIEKCETVGQTDTLWADIAKATAEARDVPAHEELRAAIMARRKALKKSESTI